MGSRLPYRLPPAVIAALLALLVAGSLGAAPDEEGAKGPAYRNKELGVSAQGPTGWKKAGERAVAVTRWQPLVAFVDADTGTRATLSVRNRTATRLDDLLADVRTAWTADAGQMRVSSMRKIEATALSPIGTVVVDASYVQKPEAPKPKEGEPPGLPPPPVTFRVQATYYLGPGHEFRLYAEGQQAHWARMRKALDALRGSVKIEGAALEGPKGAGTYRNDVHGFSCSFPEHYTVVQPQRENHVVQFEGVGAGDPLLGIYVFPWEESFERDADRLIQYYEEEKGGQASMRRIEVAGREAMLVTANATIGGRDHRVLVAILKRGGDCFRLRASMSPKAAARGDRVFKRFLASFKLQSAAR